MKHPHSRRRTIAALLAAGLAVGTVRASGAAVVASMPTSPVPAQFVIKLDPVVGTTVGDIEHDRGVHVVKSVLASRGIYLVEATASAGASKKAAKALSEALSKDQRLLWAEPNDAIDASDDRFHAWPEGDATYVGDNPSLWQHQAAATTLQLGAAHQLSTGEGAIVAVLDTGIDTSHPVFAGKLLPAWDYVDDDSDPSDVADSADNDGDLAVDEAFGHGTHVAGIVALVAPEAQIIPARVLDADGRGNVFVVAEAINDVVNAGAKVINISFGTADLTDSKLLKDAIAEAKQRGAVVVASAGNSASTTRRFPASIDKVISVAGLDSSESRLATFSNRGAWVFTAAPSSEIVSAVPGGGFAAWSGTSMAAPFVSGEVALIFGRQPGANVDHILKTVSSSCTKLRNGAKGDPPSVDILASLQRLK
jgi:subtilisin family serine protease